MTEHSDITLAYLAGAIDSDGCITIVRLTYAVRSGKGRTPPFHEQISLKQASSEIADLLKETFGGWRWDKPAKGTHRKMYEWRAECSLAVAAARALLPYLRIKRQQAELLFKMDRLKEQPREGLSPPSQYRNRWGSITTVRHSMISEEQLRQRETLWHAIKALNMNGNNVRRPLLI